MASIIRSIAYKNFYNFYGEFSANTYEFTEGLNIINADNGMGKSKMYNGILWILKDTVYDSDTREMDGVVHAALKILSQKAKREEYTPEAAVRIVFDDERFRYTITKTIKYTRINASANPDDDEAWTVGMPLLEVKKDDLIDHTSSIVYDRDLQDEIIQERLLSRTLQTYSLLQGEAIDNIVDLSNSTKLSSTIETLTDLSQLKKIETSVIKFVKDADKELETKQRASAGNKAEFENAKKEKAELERQIEQTEEAIRTYKSDLRLATEDAEKFASQLSNTEKRVEYREKVKQLNKDIANLNQQLIALNDGINDNLFKKPLPWILYGTDGYVDMFIDKRNEYTTEILAERAKINSTAYLASILPEGSPDDVSLDKMLEKCTCFVCGRPFEKNDQHYKHVEMLRNRSRQKPTAEQPKLSAFFGDIQKSIAPFMQVDPISGQIADSIKAEREIRRAIQAKEKERDNTITDLENYGGSAGDLDNTSDANALSKYNKALNDITLNNGYISSAGRELNNLKEKLEDKCSKMASFGGAAVPQANKDLVEVLKDVNAIFANTKKRIYDEVLCTLEQKSNEFYQKLTVGGNVDGGRLVFSKTSYDAIQLKVIRDSGGEFTGASEGFQRMKKIAVVMAIISSKFGGGHFDYPFIADAPFSAFGKNFIGNFFEAVPDVFSQCIIMIKDLYDVDKELLISDDGKKILDKMTSGEIKGTFYVNYVPQNTEASGMVTKIKRYK